VRERILCHLERLVSFDTRNPPRLIDEGGIFAYCAQQLSGFDVRVRDHGAGSISLFATRGAPRVLVNVHLDTVPSSPAWSADPHTLRVAAERAIGLGACDIKGAAAALLAAAAQVPGDLALLFTSDEEANDARGVAAFLAEKHAFDAVLVAEPTQCEAVLAHRGISSVLLNFTGQAGHASGANALLDSALHQAVRFSNGLLDRVETDRALRFGGLTGLRLNIGRIEGGIKANMIAPTTELRFGFRPLPSQDIDRLHADFRALLPVAERATYQETFRGPSLPSGDVAAAEERRLAARDVADALGLPIGNAVDFWTEASLFSQAGYDALVFGPGDIAQAHTADEWVAIDQLERAAAHYSKVIQHGLG
jgi:acetylornithine deacetylase